MTGVSPNKIYQWTIQSVRYRRSVYFHCEKEARGYLGSSIKFHSLYVHVDAQELSEFH